MCVNFLFQVVFYIVKMFLKVTENDTQNKTWQMHSGGEDILELAAHLISPDPKSDSSLDEVRTPELIENWITKSPLFLKIFERVFNELFPVIKVRKM